MHKCTKFCSTDKLEVADKYFGLLTKNYLMDWQIQGLKMAYQAIFGCTLESLNSDFTCVNRSHMSYFYELVLGSVSANDN